MKTVIEIEAAWKTEIEQRIKRYDSGETVAIPTEEVFAELDRLLRK